MTDLITFFDINKNLAIYTGENIHGLYHYLKFIGFLPIFNTSVQRSHHFGTSTSTNNDTGNLKPVITDIHIRQKNIYKCCGILGHKADAYIICVPNFLPPILRINMKQFNSIHHYEATGPLIEWNSQPPVVHFGYQTSPPKTISMVFSIMGGLNHHSIHNGDVEIYPSEY